jgi:hypothetical protein
MLLQWIDLSLSIPLVGTEPPRVTVMRPILSFIMAILTSAACIEMVREKMI